MIKYAILGSKPVYGGKVVGFALSNDGPKRTWVDITGVSPVPAVGWVYDGDSFHPPVETETPTPPRVITPLAMSNRIGATGKEVAIEIASETDAEVRVAVRKLTLATYIDLDLPQNALLLALLQAKSLLTQDDVDAIINTPIDSATEAYKGVL